MSAIDVLHAASGRFADATRGRSRLLGVGLAAAAATIAATVASRRRAADMVTLPDPAGRATETAMSVHNAAKSTMLSAARTAESADLDVIIRTAREAVADGIEAGVDLVPVAIGLAGGAAEVAHLFDRSRRELAACAATASIEAAKASGETAASRVMEALAGLPLA